MNAATEKHMPMVAAKMGDACLRYTVDKGTGGGVPGSPPTYVGMCHIFCESVESFQAGFGPHAEEIMADIATICFSASVTPEIGQ